MHAHDLLSTNTSIPFLNLPVRSRLRIEMLIRSTTHYFSSLKNDVVFLLVFTRKIFRLCCSRTSMSDQKWKPVFRLSWSKEFSRNNHSILLTITKFLNILLILQKKIEQKVLLENRSLKDTYLQQKTYILTNVLTFHGKKKEQK